MKGRRAGDGTCLSPWRRRCHLRCRCWSLQGCCLNSEKVPGTGEWMEIFKSFYNHERKVINDTWNGPIVTCELTAAAAEFSKASTASSHPKKPFTDPLSLSPRSGAPPKAPSKVAGPVTSPPNCCCSAASQIRSSSEAGVGPCGPPWTGLSPTFP